VVSAADPYGRNLCFLDRRWYGNVTHHYLSSQKPVAEYHLKVGYTVDENFVPVRY
jgi:hypothetical protein